MKRIERTSCVSPKPTSTHYHPPALWGFGAKRRSLPFFVSSLIYSFKKKDKLKKIEST